MEIRHFKTFKSIVENGSFSKAAQKLGYTQSTVTAQIQHLEEALSIKLFEKIGRNMVLTELGKKLVPFADEMLETVKKIENIGKEKEMITGELRIAAGESLLTYLMQDVLKRFREKAPNVKLSLSSLSCYGIQDALLKGEADIGLMYDVGEKKDNLIYTNLADFPMVVICSPALEMSKLNLDRPGQVLEPSLIINEPDSIYRRMLRNFFTEKQIVVNDIIELWSLESIKNCVASNLGFSYMPRFVAERELDRGELIEVPAECNQETITAVSLHHKNKWISPAMRLFMDLTAEAIQ